MSIDTSMAAGMVALRIVVSTKTTDYPDGNAPNAWMRLKAAYKADTGAKLSRLTKEFYGMDMKEGQDPEIFITKLEYNQYWMEELGTKITDKQLKIHILNNLPMEYDVSVNLLMRRFTMITLEESRADLRCEYDQLKSRKNDSGSNNNNNNSNEEHALFYGGKFKGKCHYCGQYGHQIEACWVKDPSKKPNGSGSHGDGQQQNSASGRGGNNQGGRGGQRGQGGGRLSGTCHYCQKAGH
jgi:gag-polypeptide of LTR copia-type